MIKIQAKNSSFFEDKNQKNQKTLKHSNFRFRVYYTATLSKVITFALKPYVGLIKAL